MDVNDLSTAGWSVWPGCSSASSVVLEGRVIPCDEIVGVITLRPAIFQQELHDVVVADRDYVASELNAFLWAWLSGLSCPVINPPTTGCLSGPAWPLERWLHLAERLEIPLNAASLRMKRRDDPSGLPPLCSTSILGELTSDGADQSLTAHTRALARAAGATFLTATFDSNGSDGRLLFVTTLPNCSSLDTTTLLEQFFFGNGECPSTVVPQ